MPRIRFIAIPAEVRAEIEAAELARRAGRRRPVPSRPRQPSKTRLTTRSKTRRPSSASSSGWRRSFGRSRPARIETDARTAARSRDAPRRPVGADPGPAPAKRPPGWNGFTSPVTSS